MSLVLPIVCRYGDMRCGALSTAASDCHEALQQVSQFVGPAVCLQQAAMILGKLQLAMFCGCTMRSSPGMWPHMLSRCEADSCLPSPGHA